MRMNLVKTGAVNDEEGLGGRYWTRELPHDLKYSERYRTRAL